MRILMLVPSFFPHIGGVEKHTLEISRNLIIQGHDIVIFTLKFDEKLANFEKFNKISIIRLLKKNYFKIWSQLLKYRSWIKNFDIIHCHDFPTFYWFIPLLIYNSNLYITFHGFEKYPIPKIYIFLRKIAEIVAKGNICVGKFITKYYKTKPTFITYGGMNIPKKYELFLPINITQKSALFIGRLETDTGILEYIKAIKILKYDYNVEITLEICGDGKLRNIIEKFSKKYDLKIKINGFINEINDFYNKSEIILCSGYLSILEALSKKKLVISIYQNQLKKDYLMLSPFKKFILIAKTPDEIASYIVKFPEMNEDINNKINNGYNFSLNNDWVNLVQLYMKLWKK